MTSVIIQDVLYLGDATDGLHADEDPIADYDRVVCIGAQNSDNTTDHFDIPDGGWGFSRDEHYPLFKEAVNTVRDAVQDGETVLVHCNVGQSRSPSVVIAVLATLRGESYDDVLLEVQKKRQIVNPQPELRYCAKSYIEAYQTIFDRDEDK